MLLSLESKFADGSSSTDAKNKESFSGRRRLKTPFERNHLLIIVYSTEEIILDFEVVSVLRIEGFCVLFILFTKCVLFHER
jgi:hypothetical protein